MLLPEAVHLGPDICGALEQAERREWWLANDLGSYAAGTVAGSLTRRYHGLFIANLTPPLGRFLVLAKADATLLDGQQAWPLFANRWAGGTVTPAGHVHIESFRLAGRMPVWRFAIGDLALKPSSWCGISAGVGEVPVIDLGQALQGHQDRDVQLLERACSPEPLFIPAPTASCSNGPCRKCPTGSR